MAAVCYPFRGKVSGRLIPVVSLRSTTGYDTIIPYGMTEKPESNL